MGVVGRTMGKLFFGRLFLRAIGGQTIGQQGLLELIMGNIGSLAVAQTQGLRLLLAPVTLIATVIAKEVLTIPGGPNVNRDPLKPRIIVKQGKVQEDVVKDKDYIFYIDEIRQALRGKGIIGLAQVEYAFLEPDGKISVVINSSSNLLMPVNPQHKSISTVLIDNGYVLLDNLARYKLSEVWLEKQLRLQGVHDISEVALALLGTDGSIYVELN